MSKTIRTIPIHHGNHVKFMRTPRFKWKLLAGISRKQIVTNYDDKPVAACKENKHKLPI